MAMYSSVNFIKERIRVQETQVIADRKFALLTGVVFVLFLAGLGAFVGYRLTIKSQLSELENEITNQQTQRLQYQDTQNLFVKRQAILTRIEEIIKKRGKNWEAIDYLYSILPSKTSIQAINLSAGGGGRLEFAVRAPDIFTYQELSLLLQSEEVKDSGFQTELGSLTRANTGEYTINVQLLISDVAEASSSAAPMQDPL